VHGTTVLEFIDILGRQQKERQGRPVRPVGSKEGRMGDALALGGEEGRDKPRKSTGSCRWASIRGNPNGATPQAGGLRTARWRTRGTETSKYPEEEKTIVMPQVVASERGTAQTVHVKACPGL
jgi:hypothetical protein